MNSAGQEEQLRLKIFSAPARHRRAISLSLTYGVEPVAAASGFAELNR
jgi:hypothetical protein